MTSFEMFLESMRGKLGDELYGRVRGKYTSLLENCAPPPLRVPDSMRANALVWGYSDLLNILPTSGSVDGNDPSGKPYVCPYQPAPVMRGEEKVDPSHWEHPIFKKPTHITSVPIRKMMERAKAHIKDPAAVTAANMLYPTKVGPFSARDGYNVPNSNYAGGDSGSSSSSE